MPWSNSTKDMLKLAGMAALFFIPFLGGVHLFDWDEINFAEISREMIELDDYLRIHVNFLPFWEKPPFFFWLQVLAMKAFGVDAFSARLPNAICGIITLVVLYRMGKHLYNRWFGLVWAIVYLGTVLPHLYFRSGIIDPWFNLFIFGGLYLFVLFYWKRTAKGDFQPYEQRGEPLFSGGLGISLPAGMWTYLFWAGFTVGMGILTKGPVAYLVVAMCLGIYWFYQRCRFYINVPQFILFTLATSLVTLAWYGFETMRHGPWFIYEFSRYQYRLFSTPDAGHKGFLGYHFVVLLIGCFPASIFAIRAHFRLPKPAHWYQADFQRWMLILFWIVLILFSIVQSKIVHYSSLCYFPLTYLATLCLHELHQKRISFNRWMTAGLIAIGGLFVIALLALPFVGNNIHWLESILTHPFARANLQAAVDWPYTALLPGLWLLIVLVAGIRWFQQGNIRNGILGLFMGMALFITFTLWTSIHKIERYSQGAAIDFFKSVAEEDCYIQPWSYKTYGHLFYGQRSKAKHAKADDIPWLLGDKEVDKPVYFITKIHMREGLDLQKNLEVVAQKNGFIFYKRKDQ